MPRKPARATPHRLAVRDVGIVRVVTLTAPREGAAAMIQSLVTELGEASDGIGAVVLHGVESFGSVGWDAGSLGAREGLMQAVEAAPPAVACLRGNVSGAALELACACDFRFADSAAHFSVSAPEDGSVPGLEFLARLAAVVGLSRARELALEGRELSADAALASGLVDEVHPARRLESEALALASRLSARPSDVLRGVKQALAVLGRARPERRERDELAWRQKRSLRPAR